MNDTGPSSSGRAEDEYFHWHREHAQWESDISRWQADHQFALAELDRISERVVNHGAALRRHATDLEAHERALTVMEESSPACSVPEATLNAMTKNHARYREVHERIRRHHDNALALLRTLSDALRASL